MLSSRHLPMLAAAILLGATVEVREETAEEREARKELPPDPEELARQKREDVRHGVYGIAARDELLKAEQEAWVKDAVEIKTACREPSTKPEAVAIRQETMSRKELNFRKRLPRGHPDRIEG